MILFITAPGHLYTIRTLVERTFGAETPLCQATTYNVMFHVTNTLRATHIFTDMERLYDWELTLAADLYRSMRDAGIPCLNDPARVMCRYELLRNLHLKGINPFTVYRAIDRPQPARFPVFLRFDAEHSLPLSDLLPDQETLDAKLATLRAEGIPLRGVIVVEYASEPAAPGVWLRFGTYRVGDAVLFDHYVGDDKWLVKYGKRGLATDEMFEQERAAIISNRFADELRPVFEIAGIEWGRADHASYDGRQIVYEVNTNPGMVPLQPQRSPIRDEALLFARQRMARHLWQIDFGDGSPLPLPASERLMQYRGKNFGIGLPSIRP